MAVHSITTCITCTLNGSYERWLTAATDQIKKELKIIKNDQNIQTRAQKLQMIASHEYDHGQQRTAPAFVAANKSAIRPMKT